MTSSTDPDFSPAAQLRKVKQDKARRKRMGQAEKMGVGTCKAKMRKGGLCSRPAGWGTVHPGIGRCKMHGGSAPTHVKAAAKQEMRTMLGVQWDIGPLEALLLCIKIRAGEVRWLSDRMAELDEKAWVEDTIVGKQFHLYARERQKAMQDLARFSQMAISLGIAERAVKVAETYGDLIAKLIQGILGDLDLTAEQRAKVPLVVRKHLIMLDGAQELEELSIDHRKRAIPAKTA
jgi:hypothetical protein